MAHWAPKELMGPELMGPDQLCIVEQECVIDTTANAMFHRRGPFCPRLRMRRMNTLVIRSTNSFWLP